MTSLSCISINDLQRNGAQYVGRGLRLISKGDIIGDVPSFGEQALQDNVTYTYGGSDGRTMVFVNRKTDLPLQIFYSELEGMHFIVDSRT